jgi:hypothetical protein
MVEEGPTEGPRLFSLDLYSHSTRFAERAPLGLKMTCDEKVSFDDGSRACIDGLRLCAEPAECRQENLNSSESVGWM